MTISQLVAFCGVVFCVALATVIGAGYVVVFGYRALTRRGRR